MSTQKITLRHAVSTTNSPRGSPRGSDGLTLTDRPIPVNRDDSARLARRGRSAASSLDDVQRRIMGIETEFGVTCTFHGHRRLSPDEVARYLFRRVVSWGRSSNVFLRNGARLYLDVGSHPEYATAECDSLVQLVTHDRAGERVLEDLLCDAEHRRGGREGGSRGACLPTRSGKWPTRASAETSTCSRTTPTRRPTATAATRTI